MEDADLTAPSAVHAEYLAEMNAMVDEQVGALATYMRMAGEQLATQNPAFANLQVTHERRSITASLGGKTATFTIVDVDEIPIEQRAAVMADGQAHCTVAAPDGSQDTWVLHRTMPPAIGDTANSDGVEGSPTFVEQADDLPVYTWMHAGDGRAIDVAALTTLFTTYFS